VDGGLWKLAHHRAGCQHSGAGLGQTKLGRQGCMSGQFIVPSALALVPGLGLLVREIGNEGRLQAFH
jgi:hypothetical protein